MKTMHKNISTLLIILATLALLLVGCSDMMVKMGEIVLTIEAEDTIRTSVTKYKVTGSLEGGSKATIDLEVTMPANEVVVPNIAPGKWTFLVEAFDAAYSTDIPIGRGTQVINLVEGQKVGLKVPVEFMPLQLSISAPFFPDTLDKVYDGTTTLAVTSGDLSGLIDGYNRVRAEARATYADKGAGRDKAVTVSYDLVYDDATITNKYAPLADNIEYKGEIKQRQLTISAPIFPKTENKEYDGTNALAITAGDFTNLVEGDDVTVTAHAEYSDKNAEEAKVITITYTISGSDAANYITPVTDTTNTGTITKKPLTFTVGAEDKKYNGDVAAEGAITLAGMVPSDAGEVGATGTFAFSDKNVAGDKTVNVTAIELTGAEKDNYSISEKTASTTASISKKTFDMGGITFASQSPTYDGNSHPLAIGGALPDGVTVSYSVNNSSTQAGTYEVTASFSVDEANHETIPDRTETLTIRKKALTTDGTYLTRSKVYDRNLTAQVGIDQVNSGKVSGDSIVLSVEAYYADSSVSENKTIAVSYTLTGDKIQNYIKPADYTVTTGSVTPIPLSISNPSIATSKPYDGNDNLSVTKGTLSGFLTGDTVSVTATAKYGDKNVGTNKEITVSYALDQFNANYLAPVPYTIYTGVITPIQLGIGNPSLSTPSKTYDGNDSISGSLTLGALSGVLPSDQGTVTVQAAAAYADKNVGTDKAVTVSYTLDEANANARNYLAPVAHTVRTASITERQLTITPPGFPQSKDKAYDGNATLSISKGVLGGVVAGDYITVTVAATYADQNIGDAKGITVTYAIEGMNTSNYLPPVADATSYVGRITKQKLTISNPTLEKTKTYDGTLACQVTPGNIVKGLVGDEAMQITATASFDTKDFGTNKTITVHYSLTVGDKDKYIAPDDYISRDGKIEKQQLVLTVLPVPTLSKEYDGTASVEFTAGKVTGVIGEEAVDISEEGCYQETGVGTGKGISFSYALTGSDAKNYLAPPVYTFRTGKITRKALVVGNNTTVIETAKTYDGNQSAKVTDHGTLIGVVSGENVTLEARASYSDKNFGTGKSLSVAYYLYGSDAGNYTVPIGYSVQGGSIGAKTLAAGVPNFTASTSKMYDGNTRLPVTAGALIGLVGSDDVRLYAVASYEYANAMRNNKITVAYTLAGYDKDNYSIPVSYTVLSGVITPIPLSISNPSIATSKPYDGNDNLSVTKGTLSGFLTGDTVSVTATAKYGDKNVGTNKEITVTYALDEVNANYLAPATYTVTTGVITAIPLTIGYSIFPTSNTKVYDGNTTIPVIAGALSGILPAEKGTVTVKAEASYSSADVVPAKTITVKYTLGGLDAANYTAPKDSTGIICSITPKKLKVHADTTQIRTEKSYDGTDVAQVLARGVLDGLVGSDRVTLTTAATYRGGVDAGQGKIIDVTYSIEGADASNYSKPDDYTILNGAIKAIQLAIQEPTFSDTGKVYSGTTSFDKTRISLDQNSLTGVATGDAVSVNVATAVYDNKNVGTNKAVTVSYALEEANANYLAPVTYTIYTGVITPIQLGIGNPSLSTPSKTYDGKDSVSGSITLGDLSGALVGDMVTVTPSAKYLDRNVDATKTIIVSYTLSGSDAGNYRAPSSAETNGVINPLKLEIDNPYFPNNGSKTYDGNTNAIVSPGLLTNGVDGDWIFVKAEGSYDTKHAVGYKNIRVTYTLYGPNASNYLAPDSSEMDNVGLIRKKQLYIEDPIIPNTSKEYDDEASIIYTPGALIGKCENDEVAIDQTSSKGFYNSKNIENDKNMFFTYELTGSDAGNYISPRINLIKNGEITQKTLTVKGSTVTPSKIYDGVFTATVTAPGTLSGFVAGFEDVTLTATASYADKKAGNSKDITVRYELGGKDSGKYKTPADLTIHTGVITPKQLTINAPIFPVGIDRAYDGGTALDVTAGTLVGILGEDVVTVRATATYADKNASVTAKAISVTYELDGFDAGNYSKPVKDTSNVGMVSKAVIDMTGFTYEDKTVTYDGEYQSFSLTGALPSGTSSSYSGQTYAGTYLITISFSVNDSRNFTLSPASTTATLKIEKKPLTISEVAANGKIYDGSTNTSGMLSLSGIVGLDDVRATGVFAFADANVSSSAKTVNVTGIALSGDKKSNYSLANTTTTAQAKINPKPLTISSITVNPKTYNGNVNATGSILLGGIIGSDDVSATGTFSFADANASSSAKTVNVTGINIVGTNASNYSLSSTTDVAQAKIDRASYDMAGVFFTSATSTYDGNMHPLAISGTLPTGVTVSYNDNNKKIDAGEYFVTASFTGDTTNFDAISSKTATLKIEKAAMTGSLTINGTAKVGQTLTYNTSLVVGSNPSYQWKRNGVSISGATGTSYTLVLEDFENTISVTATATGANYSGSKTSAPTAIVVGNGPPAPTGTIAAYNLTSASDQNIINLTGFAANATGLEATVALSGTTYVSYQALAVDGRGRARIYVPGNAIANTTKVKVRVASKGAVFAGDHKEITLGASKALGVGDFYQGGIVAYLGTFTTLSSGTKQGLIVSENNMGNIRWNNGINVNVGVGASNGDNDKLGAGKYNTDKIISVQREVSTSYAAGLARSYSAEGTSDTWFLPSREELNKVHENRVFIGIGTFSSVNYWTSSESSRIGENFGGWGPDGYVASRNFHNPLYEFVERKEQPCTVRPVRYF